RRFESCRARIKSQSRLTGSSIASKNVQLRKATGHLLNTFKVDFVPPGHQNASGGLLGALARLFRPVDGSAKITSRHELPRSQMRLRRSPSGRAFVLCALRGRPEWPPAAA